MKLILIVGIFASLAICSQSCRTTNGSQDAQLKTSNAPQEVSGKLFCTAGESPVDLYRGPDRVTHQSRVIVRGEFSNTQTLEELYVVAIDLRSDPTAPRLGSYNRTPLHATVSDDAVSFALRKRPRTQQAIAPCDYELAYRPANARQIGPDLIETTAVLYSYCSREPDDSNPMQGTTQFFPFL